MCLGAVLAGYGVQQQGDPRREPLSARLLHVVPLVVAGVLIGVRDMPWPLMLRVWPRSLSLYWLGVALVAAGLAFAVWARVHLGRNWSGSVTVKEAHELIRTGPYGYVRHPIYTGLIAAMLGTVIASGTVRALLALVIVVVSLLRKLRTEEAFMRETFPARVSALQRGGAGLDSLHKASAICTALSAAPFSSWSPATNRQMERPLGSLRSWRMRPTRIGSWPEASCGMGK